MVEDLSIENSDLKNKFERNSVDSFHIVKPSSNNLASTL